ncbi:regulatory protein, tetR family [Pleomorphomonas diazotrophica]|uniref:TetR/AcrR family transcriptional regulator n=1 Tax=Pleomorphomonas diazotrophica TaxID=1166257 RepID=UPI0008F006E6|nr:TetR/AcrR family transcriptional regulator [Pleomorphomonas diazotrophica]SFM90506.1 regulatory protein, tetR family [Pleomorphomonas diazotrophica]
MTIDRRVLRTRTALYDALVDLIRERDYEAITVEDILARANVGRSTFYAHFKSKDELLEKSLERLRQELIAAVEATPEATIFTVTRTLFEHVHRHRDIHFALAKGTRGALLHESIAANFAQVVRTLLPNARGGSIPRELAISHISGSFLCVLRWWMDRNPSVTPAEADGLFCRLVFSGLGEEFGAIPEPPER